MKAVVIYESMFGNTRDVANAIASGLASAFDVDTIEVGAAPSTIDDDVALLVVGGPTHAMGLSRRSTRESAAAKIGGAPVSAGTGLREWLARLGPGHVDAAAFDTRVHAPVPGSAAKAARRRLRALGYRMAMPPETFWVGGTPGPLVEGEVDRARRWGERLGASLRSAVPTAR